MSNKFLYKIQEYSIYFLLILSFSLYSSLTEGTIINSLIIWPIVLLSIICILYKMINYTQYSVNNLVKYLIIFILSYLISMLINIKGEFYQSLRTFVLMIIVFLNVFIKRKQDEKINEKHIKKFCNIFLTISTILSFLSLCIFNISQMFIDILGQTKYITGLRWGRLEGFYTDVNYGSAICVIAILMAIYQIYINKRNKINLLFVISIVLNFSYVILADSRMALLALLVTTIVGTWYIKKGIGKKVFSILIAICLIFGARFAVKTIFNKLYDHQIEQVYIKGFSIKTKYQIHNETENNLEKENEVAIDSNNNNLSKQTDIETINNEKEETNKTINEQNIYDRQYSLKNDISNRRFDLWKSSFEIFKTKPIFGVSFENIENYSFKYLPNTYLINNDYKQFDNFHNIFFNVLAGQGILGATTLIIIYLYIFIKVYVISHNKMKDLEKSEKYKRIFMKGIITVGLIESIFIGDIIYYISPVSIAFWFIIGFFLNWLEEEKIKNKKYSKIYRVVPKIYRIFFIRLFNTFPISKNKIICSNFSGNGYGDSPKYIIEEINKLNLDYKLIWVISNEKNKEGLPQNVKAVIYDSIEYFYHICTAKIWIDNHRKIIDLKKRKKQFYIQTWHGGIALKKVEKDAQLNLNKEYINQAMHDSKMADLFISNSSFCSNMYKNAFWYNGDIKEWGTPRNDILINYCKEEKRKEKIIKRLNIEGSKKIILYAPTFRKNENLKCYDINLTKIIMDLNKKTHENWICLLRLHPIIANKSKEFDFYSNDIIDVSNYDDMYELMLVSDLLVTDYSSVMFEFSFMKKPVFLYASDINTYVDERGFYFDYFKLPYPVAQNNNEMEKIIDNFNLEKYNNNLKTFFDKIGLKESGEASKRVVEIIKRKIEEG